MDVPPWKTIHHGRSKKTACSPLQERLRRLISLYHSPPLKCRPPAIDAARIGEAMHQHRQHVSISPSLRLEAVHARDGHHHDLYLQHCYLSFRVAVSRSGPSQTLPAGDSCLQGDPVRRPPRTRSTGPVLDAL